MGVRSLEEMAGAVEGAVQQLWAAGCRVVSARERQHRRQAQTTDTGEEEEEDQGMEEEEIAE